MEALKQVVIMTIERGSVSDEDIDAWKRAMKEADLVAVVIQVKGAAQVRPSYEVVSA